MGRINESPLRSVLYMPASNAKALAKARTLDCDGVIIDLEDAVAPSEKDDARRQAIEAIQADGFGRRRVVLRINGLDTPWGTADVQALTQCVPDAVLVPKVSSAEDVLRYNDLLEGLPAGIELWVMIETAKSIFHLAEIAAAANTTRLTTFVMGTNDLAKETGARLVPGRMAFVSHLSLSVAAAKMAGLAILDGVNNALDDDDALETECRQGLELGFDGKTLIHPRQIGIANSVFAPSSEEIRFAEAVIAAFAAPENAGHGALRVEGRMVERLHLQQCEKLVSVAHAIVAADG